MAQCPHGYWHASQCPYCEIGRLRRRLLVADASLIAMQRDHDRAVGEARLLRRWLNKLTLDARKRRKRRAARKSAKT